MYSLFYPRPWVWSRYSYTWVDLSPLTYSSGVSLLLILFYFILQYYSSMLLKIKPISQKGPQCHSLQSQPVCLSDESSASLLSGSPFLWSNKQRDSGFSFFTGWYTPYPLLHLECFYHYLENSLPSSQKPPTPHPRHFELFFILQPHTTPKWPAHVLGNVVMNNFMHSYFLLWGVCLQGKSLRAWFVSHEIMRMEFW